MDTKFIAVETCGLVTSKMADGGVHMPVVCRTATEQIGMS
jgi:hypothetical protein